MSKVCLYGVISSLGHLSLHQVHNSCMQSGEYSVLLSQHMLIHVQITNNLS